MKKILLGVVAVGCLTGCSTALPIPTPSFASSLSSSPTPSPILSVVDSAPNPITLRIPELGVDTGLVSLGLTKSGEQEVPSVKTPEVAGWFEPGPEPGEPGAAVLLGHVNGSGKWGVFARLTELKAGSTVQVDDRTYTVYEVMHAPKDKFPTDRVYTSQGPSEIRLITCGGSFDKAAQSYRDNIIVFAR